MTKNDCFVKKSFMKIFLIIFLLIISIFAIIPAVSGQSISSQMNSQLYYKTNVNNSNIPSNSVMLPDSIISGGLMSDNTYQMSAINSTKIISVMISLKFQNQDLMNYLLNSIQDKNSDLYLQYVTKQEFIDLFSPDINAYNSLADFFIQNGFIVSKYDDRVALRLEGEIIQFENVFHTEVFNFEKNSNSFYAPISSLSINSPFGIYITGINGLNSRYSSTSRPMFDTGCILGNCSSQMLYGSDFQKAYQLDRIYSDPHGGYPIGLTIALILWTGCADVYCNPIPPFYPADIEDYFDQTLPSNQPRPHLYADPVTISGITPPLPGIGATHDFTFQQKESTLDIEMAGSLAPGANIVEVYNHEFSAEDSCIAEILNPSSSDPNVNSALLNTVVISYSAGNPAGDPSPLDSVWESYVLEANLRGITVLASSGDYYTYQTAAYPADTTGNEFGVVAVGGTSTTLSGSPSLDGSNTAGFLSQSVWYNTPAYGAGSQGGFSGSYPIPMWQSSSSDVYNILNNYKSPPQYRATPDIAAVAENMEIYITNSYYDYSGMITVWGTSISSPLMAGVIASIDHFLLGLDAGTEGLFLPTIYQLGQYQFDGKYANNPPYYDIANSGSTEGYAAFTGYDLATGWGSINALNFLQAQIGPFIYITNPSDGSSYTTASNDFIFSGIVSDINDFSYTNNIPNINGYIDGTNLNLICNRNTDITDTISYTCSHNVHPGSYATGYHTLTVIAYDSEGWPRARSITILIGTPPPPPPPRGCVAQNTPIYLANGKIKMVQSLKIGDFLLGYDFQNSKLISVELVNITMTTVSKVLVINDGLLELTPLDQPIYIRNSSFTGWLVNPIDLKIGDELFNPITNNWIFITSLFCISGNFHVYDVETSPMNNFIANGVLLDRKIQ